MSDVAKIAEGLTKAQRRVVLTDSSGFHPDYYGRWSVKTVTTERAIIALGLAEKAFFGPLKPTPLGLAVRTHLESKNG